MLVPVSLILGVLWLTIVLVFVAACRMAARGDGALAVWESVPASAGQQAPRWRARPIARGARGHAGRSAAGS